MRSDGAHDGASIEAASDGDDELRGVVSEVMAAQRALVEALERRQRPGDGSTERVLRKACLAQQIVGRDAAAARIEPLEDLLAHDPALHFDGVEHG